MLTAADFQESNQTVQAAPKAASAPAAAEEFEILPILGGFLHRKAGSIGGLLVEMKLDSDYGVFKPIAKSGHVPYGTPRPSSPNPCSDI